MGKFKLKYTSFLDEIEKDFKKEEKAARAVAAKHLRKKLKEKTVERFGTDSNITKGVRMQNLKHISLVGIGPPGYQAHLIEFGTDERYQKSGKPTGQITSRRKHGPRNNAFVMPTFNEETKAIMEILSREWF